MSFQEEDKQNDHMDNSVEELMLTKAMSRLTEDISRYNQIVKHIWFERVKPYVLSADCNILDNLDTDGKQFHHYMISQPLYIEMNRRLRLLQIRYSYLIHR